jgi:hypothetical protein
MEKNGVTPMMHKGSNIPPQTSPDTKAFLYGYYLRQSKEGDLLLKKYG